MLVCQGDAGIGKCTGAGHAEVLQARCRFLPQFAVVGFQFPQRQLERELTLDVYRSCWLVRRFHTMRAPWSLTSVRYRPSRWQCKTLAVLSIFWLEAVGQESLARMPSVVNHARRSLTPMTAKGCRLGLDRHCHPDRPRQFIGAVGRWWWCTGRPVAWRERYRRTTRVSGHVLMVFSAMLDFHSHFLSVWVNWRKKVKREQQGIGPPVALVRLRVCCPATGQR